MGNNNENDNYEWDRVVETDTWTLNTEEIEKSIIDSTLMQDENLFIAAAMKEQSEKTEQSEKAVEAVAEKLKEVRGSIDESDKDRIRREVNKKIIIQSEELKNKRSKPAKKKLSKREREEQELAKVPVPSFVSSEIYAVESQSRSYIPGQSADQVSDSAQSATGRETGAEPSDFRKRSANWRDEPAKRQDGYPGDFGGRGPGRTRGQKKVPGLTWITLVLAVIILFTGIQTTAVYAEYMGKQEKARALASMESFVEDEAEEVLADVEEKEVPVAAEEPEEEEEELKSLSLVLSSVEKDLKIKLVDQDETLVRNVPWSVTVTDDRGDEETREDDDEDGVIHLTDMSAGDYSVSINPSDSLAGYILPDGIQTCSVKATVEYKVIANIRDEIKTEKEVNAAAEDANGNKAADVETGTAPTDTVEWCESTKTAGGETYVEAIVDITKTAALEKKESPILAFINSLNNSSRSIFSRVFVAATPIFLTEATVSGNEVPGEGKEKDPSGSSSEGSSSENEENGSSSDKKGKTDDSSISLSGYASVAEGASATISAAVTPSDTTISWSSSDSSIARTETSEDTLTVTVTGVKPGSVKITAEGSNGKKAEMTFTVTGKYSDSAQLYDSEKNALYVEEDGQYRLAKYADYIEDSSRRFYKKVEEFLYTGWQTIDGVTYYYKSDHTYVTGEQIIQGVSYTFSDNGALAQGSGTLGIDVSKYQPNINWSSVKASGVSFVIIRCGYRGASTGVLIQDPYYTSHIKGAKAAGLKVGIYFFSTALNEAEAVEEASMCVALAGGYGVNYPVFIDVESSPRPGYDALSASERTANISAFCKTIRSAGYSAGVYANKNWLTEKIHTSELSGYKIWLAQYNAGGPTYNGRYDLWQYTSRGSVDGISGNVDMNQSYLGY